MPDIGRLPPRHERQAARPDRHRSHRHPPRLADGLADARAELLSDTGLFDVRITEDFRGAGPETLENYDLVVLNYFGRFEPWGRAPEQRWGARAEQAIYDHVAAGKGVVVYHASLQMGKGWEDDFSGWPAA